MSKARIRIALGLAGIILLACCGSKGGSGSGASGGPPFGGIRQTGTPEIDGALGVAVAVDRNGNIYVSGDTDGDLDGQANSGGSDAFLIKFDAAGNKIYTRLLGTGRDDSACAVAVDDAGNVYIAGSTEGTLDVNAPNPGLAADAFVAKYSTSGTLMWVRQLGTGGIDLAKGVAVGAAGDAYVVGETEGILDPVTASPGAGVSTDIFVARFTPTGERVWLRQYGTAGADEAAGIAVGQDGTLWFAGSTFGILDPATQSPGKGTSFDFFVSRIISADGSLVAVSQRGTAKSDVATGIALDAAGNVYVVGSTRGGLDNNVNAAPGAATADVFLSKFDSEGRWLFTRQFGTPADDAGNCVGADAAGNVFVAGSTKGSLDGTNSGATDAFVTKSDGSGTLLFARQFGSANEDISWSLAVIPGGVILAGSTTGSLGSDVNADPSTAAGPPGPAPDLFLAKFSSGGVLR